MSVLVDGTSRHNWRVSTGAKRYTTPSGVYKPQWLARKWRSRQFGNAPMPHSIFFHEGYAIHGTTELARLGKIASHGCVRLHPDNAATLYELVQKHMANTRVVVSDDLIEAPGEAPKKKPSQLVAENAPAKEPAIDSRKGPEATAIAPQAAAPEIPLRARKANARETSKPNPPRGEKIARAQSGGFHW
jgi:L,D-transpeptidase catalytic domain